MEKKHGTVLCNVTINDTVKFINYLQDYISLKRLFSFKSIIMLSLVVNKCVMSLTWLYLTYLGEKAPFC